MHPALTATEHRPWPLPQGPWPWRQSWLDLLFAHWPVPAASLRRLVPEELAIDEFDGTSWIGLVPFRMAGVMRQPLPDVPGISAFRELNVRLYVVRDGKPGVWFLSLDADNGLAVWAARTFFHLPYHRARMSLEESGGTIRYASARCRGAARFEGSYRPTSGVYRAEPGTLEHWLTERYCLYAKSRRGELRRTEVHHAAWPLQRAELDIVQNTMFAPHGLGCAEPPQLVHFARRVDVVVRAPERC
jgi:uncharacterized protein YqjF (DUF2071 family)